MLVAGTARGFEPQVPLFGPAPDGAAKVRIERAGVPALVVATRPSGDARVPGRFWMAWLRDSDSPVRVVALDGSDREIGAVQHFQGAVDSDAPSPLDVRVPKRTKSVFRIKPAVSSVPIILKAFADKGQTCSFVGTSDGGGSMSCLPYQPFPAVRFGPSGEFHPTPYCTTDGTRAGERFGLAAGAMPAGVAKVRFEFSDGQVVEAATRKGGPDPEVVWYLAELPLVWKPAYIVYDTAGKELARGIADGYVCS